MAKSHNESDLIAQYAQLVRKLAIDLKEKSSPSIDVNDLIQDGMIGLLDAAKRYDPESGCTFSTFATPRIRGAMIDGLRGMDRLSRMQRSAVRTVEKAIQVAEHQLGRTPTDFEMADRMNIPVGEFQALLAEAYGTQLMYLEDMASYDTAGFVAPDTLALVEEQDMRRNVVGLIANLPERDREILKLYYNGELSVSEIAATMGVTPGRICQIHGKAIQRIRKAYQEQHREAA